MDRAAKLGFVALVLVLLGYVVVCMGLYVWGLRQWPPHSLEPPAPLPPALQRQIEQMEGVSDRPPPRLNPLTLALEIPLAHDDPQWAGMLYRSAPYHRLPRRQQRAHYVETPTAIHVSRNWTRAQIVSGYARNAYFGRDAYGLEAAAQAWYGLPLAQLEPQEITVLWGLLQSPRSLDPLCRPKRFDVRFGFLARRVPELANASPEEARRRLRVVPCPANS